MTLEPHPLPSNYARRIPLDLSQPCWPWGGTIRKHGYAVVMIDSVEKYAHRLAYQLHVGPIPRSWEIDHVCHSVASLSGDCAGGPCVHRSCWNPAHLEAVTSRVNSERGNQSMFAIARTDKCGKGHDLSVPENVYVRADGRRRCRVCQIDGHRERRRKSKP